MSAMGLTILAVVLVDQAIKLMLRWRIGNEAFGLGRDGSLRLVAAQIWLRRLGRGSIGRKIWCVWSVAAIALVTCSAFVPLNTILLGLLLGGSLSHASESSLRGYVTDYICLRNWPSFNLADLALAVGAIGIMIQLVVIVHQAEF
jgi:lipoprotein signal peptidase